jgi:hypothetical protein
MAETQTFCKEDIEIKSEMAYIWEFIQVKNHTVANFVTNRMHKATNLNSKREFIQVKSYTVANSVTFH